MSRQNEEAYERWFKAHLVECERDLVVGARVYRVNCDKIEEGEVHRVERIRFENSIWSGAPRGVEDPAGDTLRYVASFRNDWESQTHQYRFFFRRSDALKALAKQARRYAEERRDQAERWEALATLSERDAAEVATVNASAAIHKD